jgi:outer membrane protein
MKYPGNSLMKRGKLWSVAGSVALVLASLPSFGADLLSVYDQALENDPQIAEADATRRANREVKPQAWANLLPGLSASAGRTKQWNNGSGFSERLEEIVGAPGTYEIRRQPNSSNTSGTTDQWSLQLRQTLFSIPTYMAVVTANRQVAQAEIEFVSAQQELLQRVARQYFAVLQAQDALRAQEAARDAVARQLEQAERRFEVGLIAITDVQQARAARDNANANVIGAKRTLSSTEEQLRATIGQKPTSLNEPKADMPLLTPNPASEDDWVKAALEQNAALVSSRLSADIARDTVKSTYGSFVPEVQLTAGKNFSDSDSSGETLGQSLDSSQKNHGKSIGLSFSLNLNGLGTGNYSRGRQSQYRWIAAKERLERVSRDTERQARDAYLGVNSEIARVQALKQALESNRTALAATEAGYDVGTRTTVDVLDQRQLLIAAETNYSAAKYSYLNNLIALRLAAGDLDRESIEEINRWLGPPAPPPATPAPAPAAQ